MKIKLIFSTLLVVSFPAFTSEPEATCGPRTIIVHDCFEDAKGITVCWPDPTNTQSITEKDCQHVPDYFKAECRKNIPSKEELEKRKSFNKKWLEKHTFVIDEECK